MNRRPAGEGRESRSELGGDPPRLHEDASSELGRLVRAGRLRSPSDADVRRLGGRLAASGALDAARATVRSSSGKIGRQAAIAFGGVVVMGLAGWLVTWRGTSTLRVAPHDSTAEVLAAPVIAAPVMESPAAPAEVVATVDEVPSVQVQELPSSMTVSPAPSPRKPSSPAARAPVGDPAPSSPSELALVQSAARNLRSNPAAALASAEEHARTFPAGELVQEREVLAVEALMRLQRPQEARARAAALLARFPNTPYVLRLSHALGEPAPAASSAMDR